MFSYRKYLLNNCVSNRFTSITNETDKQWIDMARDAYKTKSLKMPITEK
jgi:hypothetical protein